jgi:hypothetical protein
MVRSTTPHLNMTKRKKQTSMDIRQLALEAELENQPYWVEKWKSWVLIRELTGETLSWLLDKTMIFYEKQGKTKSKVNLEKYSVLLTVLSARNPDPSILPDKDDPHYALYPGAVDESGKYLTPPCENPGKLIFQLEDAGQLKKRSAAVLEQISKIASKMSGIRPEDLEEKKDDSESEEEETPDFFTE